MSKGLVEVVEKSKSGKAWRVKISGQWLNANFDTNIEKAVNQNIDYMSETGKFGEWLKSWVVDHVGQVAAQVQPKANGGEHTGLTEAELRFVSNVVGQAILAKTITDPLLIAQWAKAARQTLKELV